MGKKILIYLFVFFFSFYFLSYKGVGLSGDAIYSYLSVKSLVANGSVYYGEGVVNHPLYEKVIGGESYSHFGIGWLLNIIPFYYLSMLFASVLSSNIREYFMLFGSGFSILFYAAFAMVYFFRIARLFNYSLKTSLALTFLYGLGTTFWDYTKGPCIEPASMFFFLSGSFYLFRYSLKGEKSSLYLSAILLGLSTWMKITNVVVFVPYSIYLFWVTIEKRGNFKQVVKGIASFSFVFIVHVLYHLLLSRSVNNVFGYPFVGIFSFSPNTIIETVYGVFFSSGKSIFIYNLPLFLVFFSFRKFSSLHLKETVYFALILVFNVFILINTPFWGSVEAWGSRYMAIVIPGGILMTGVLYERWFADNRKKIVMLFIVLCILLQVPNSIYGSYKWWRMTQAVKINSTELLFNPTNSHLLASFKMLKASIDYHLFGKEPIVSLYKSPYFENGPSEIVMSKANLIPDLWITRAILLSDYIEEKEISYGKSIISSSKKIIVSTSSLFFLFFVIAFVYFRKIVRISNERN